MEILNELNFSVPGIWIGIIALSLLDTVLILWAVIDCSRRRFESEGMKLAWILVSVLLSPLGTLVYFLFGRKQSQPYQSIP